MPSLESHLVEAFRQRLRELGYTEGQNIAIDYRWAEGQDERLPELAADLVRLKVDVIVAGNTASTLAARRATQSIPIVMVGTGDPVEAGLVASLARPEGNVTGLSTLRPDLEGKRLGLFKEAVPRLSRVGVLRDPGNPVAKSYLESIEAAAHASRVTLEPLLEVRGIEDLERALPKIAGARPQGLFVEASRTLFAHRRRIIQFAASNRLPATYPYREYVDAGGLMSYAPSFVDMYRSAAAYVDKILKGAKPADLPVEQPTKFELVINLKTAKALGLTIPPSLLTRADQVIE